ncbi:MAG: high-potential iron-sulfur protein [Myxococcota bacterium]
MADEKSMIITRRQLMRGTLGVGAAVASSGVLLAACDDGEEEAELDCTSTEGLEAQQIQTRQTLEYTDDTPKPDQDCANCRFFESKGETTCGTCTIVPGPIHPKGWCKSWAAAEGA